MLKSYSIWGKSRFRITANNLSFIADKSECKLKYVPEPTEIVDTWTGEIIYINQKYRPTLEVNVKQFLNETHDIELSKLVEILKSDTFVVYPFYEEGNNCQIIFNNLIHTNEISFTQMVELLQSGQSISLKFKAKIPIRKQEIPTITNRPIKLGYEIARKFNI